MTGTPKDTRAAARERGEERRALIPAPDGLLPTGLWGAGLVNTPVVKAEDRAAKAVDK